MATATFAPEGVGTLRGVPAGDNGATFAQLHLLGVMSLGGSKALLERPVLRFNVFGAALTGRALTAGDVITAAELRLQVTSLPGTSGFACTLRRITRAAWDYLSSSWNNYAAGNAWTTGGGDIGTPDVPHSGPVALGAFTIAGLAALVDDAIDNRGGLLILRNAADNETNDGGTRYYTAVGAIAHPQSPRLVVTYEGQEPAPIDLPGTHTAAGDGAPPLCPAGTAGAGAAAPPAGPPRPAHSVRRTNGRRRIAQGSNNGRCDVYRVTSHQSLITRRPEHGR